MKSTILIGDYLLANHLAYSGKRTPQIGDIIIFKYFGVQEKNYIKRILAKSGQRVLVTGKHVLIDGIEQALPPYAMYIRDGHNPQFPDTFEVTVPSPGDEFEIALLSIRDFLFLYHLVKQEHDSVEAMVQVYMNGALVQPISLGQFDNWIILQRHLVQLEESSTAEQTGNRLEFHNILKVDGRAQQKYTVQKPAFFVLGDNRDNSFDSRYFGFVSLGSIIGKAKFLYLSIDTNFSIFNLAEWIRWHRIGLPIR